MQDPIEILTSEQMARADALAVRMGVPSLTLMENAGRAVADEAVKMVDAGAAIAVLCGPGNNGGDGFVAARLLKARGYDVAVYLYGAPGKLKGDAAEMASRWLEVGLVADIGAARLEIGGAALVIDAIFGAGLTRALDDEVKGAIEAAKRSKAEILAIDVPTGLSGSTGRPMGGTAFQADRTVTFFRLKPGHLLYPGRGLCGRVILADIGIPDAVLPQLQSRVSANAPVLWLDRMPTLRADMHKYHRGHTLVISGPAHATGAARLAARSALRIGAGLVTVASPPEAVAVNASQLTAVMVRPFEGPAGLGGILQDRRYNAVLVGPGAGVGRQTCELIEVVLRSGAAAVLDADALTSFAGSADRLAALINARDDRPVIITPHAGEFARLLPGRGVGDEAQTALARALRASNQLNAIALLKGPDTVIADPGNNGRSAINSNAPPWLATAGSGDVLAGLVTGLLAQGMQGFEAACAAVWIHGECANRFGPGLIAEDLPEILPAVLRELYAAKTKLAETRRGAGRITTAVEQSK